MRDVLVKRIVTGNLIHDYFGRANPSFETIDGELWLEVDFTVGGDMHDCFLANEPVTIDGVKYLIEEAQSRSSGYAGAFRLTPLDPETTNDNRAENPKASNHARDPLVGGRMLSARHRNPS